MKEFLLKTLRCPYCVGHEILRTKPNAGELEVVDIYWLVCRETKCQRKYPIVDDIPFMLIDEGSRWINTPVEQLPRPPKYEHGSVYTD